MSFDTFPLTRRFTISTVLRYMKLKTTAVSVRDVPVDLWRRLKIQAMLEGATMPTMVTKALEHYLKTEGVSIAPARQKTHEPENAA